MAYPEKGSNPNGTEPWFWRDCVAGMCRSADVDTGRVAADTDFPFKARQLTSYETHSLSDLRYRRSRDTSGRRADACTSRSACGAEDDDACTRFAGAYSCSGAAICDARTAK
jgi:hypothetical protein